MSGYPHLEEAYRTAELIFHKLPIKREIDLNERAFVSPFGEMIANQHIPKKKSAVVK